MTQAVHNDAETSVSRIVIWAAAVLASVVVAAGFVARWRGVSYGTATEPFVAGWAPLVDPLGAAVALVAGAAFVLVIPALLRVRWSPVAFAVVLYALGLALALSVNVAREGITGWTHIFDLEGGTSQSHAINEYLPGLPGLDHGVRNYLDRFAEVVPSQSVNIAGHPPGPLLLASWVGATTPAGLAALVVGIGACCAPLTYRLALTLDAEERVARLAGLLCAASPLILLFGVTSYDFAFAAFGAVAACALIARSWGWRTFGLVALAWASLMSWALLGVAAWAAIVVWRRDGLRAAVGLAALCGVAVAALQGFLAARYGYDPIGTLRATEQVYRDSLARERPYLFWVFGSPVAWALMLGPVIVAAVLRGATAGRDAAAIALLAIVVIAAVGGFTKAETERIWLCFVPLACAAAAPYVRAAPRVAIGTLVAQALIVQLLMNTVW